MTGGCTYSDTAKDIQRHSHAESTVLNNKDNIQRKLAVDYSVQLKFAMQDAARSLLEANNGRINGCQNLSRNVQNLHRCHQVQLVCLGSGSLHCQAGAQW